MANTSGAHGNINTKINCCDKYSIDQLMQPDNYQIGKSTYVDITHIIDPHSFFVQPTKYKPILNHLEQQEHPIQHVSKPKLGTLYLFHSKNAQKWIRGRIIGMEMKGEENNCNINAIDYGFIESKVPFESIKMLVCCQNLPPLCVHCRLDNCEPNNKHGWNKQGIKAFKYYTNDKPLNMTVTGKFCDQLAVELFNGDDVATLMAYSERAVFGFVVSGMNRLSCSVKSTNYSYSYKERNVGDLLHVRVLAGNTLNEFYVAEMDDYKDYVDFVRDLAYFSKNEMYVEQNDLIAGRPVVILNDNWDYQRAEIMDGRVSDDKIMVRLVDVGTKLEVPMGRIKRIQDRFLKIPPVAIACALQETRNEKLKKLIWAGERFDIVIETIGNKLEIPNLVTIKVSL